MSQLTRAEQMTLDIEPVGFGPDPIVVGTFTVSGTMTALRQMQIGEGCTITVANADGEIVATAADCHISATPIIEHESKDRPTYIERKHKIKIDE